VHSEQIQDLGGGVQLAGADTAGWSVVNGTKLPLRDAGVLQRAAGGQLSLAWVGDLAPGQTAALRFQGIKSAQEYLSSISEEARQTLSRLLGLASQGVPLGEREVRLVAWTSQALPGLVIRPQASQESVRTLVLAHLRRPALPRPQADRNLRLDIVDEAVQPIDEGLPAEAPQ